VEPYVEGLLAGGHDPSQARMSGALSAFTTLDPERDWPIVSKHLAWQADSYRAGITEGGEPAQPVDPERIRAKGLTTGFHGLLVAPPEAVAAEVRTYLGTAPVETVYFWASLAGMPEAMVREHVTTVLTKLAPLLA
jgi:hypothetical protein